MRRTQTAALAFACAFVAVAAMAAPSTDRILDDNNAATGGDAWDGKVTLSTDAAYSTPTFSGTIHAIADLKSGRSATVFQIGPAHGAFGFDGTNAWRKDTSGTVTLLEGGDAHVLAINGAYRLVEKWWRSDYAGAHIVNRGRKSEGGAAFDVLTVTPPGGKAFDAWFDARTHLLAKTVEQQGPQLVTTSMSDYRAVDGVMLPFKTVVDNGMSAKYRQTIALTQASFLGAQPDTAYAPPKVVVSDFSIADDAAETALPIKIVNNHIYGDVRVNGNGPFVFIFDTGGHNIITPPLVKEMGLPVDGAMDGGFTKIATLSVGDASVKDQLFAVVPFDRLSDIEGVPLPGMIGYETFRRFVTRVDYGAHVLTLIDPEHFDPRTAGTPVKFVFHDHIPEVAGTFEGLPAKFDIDTGARSELTLTKPFAERHKLRAKHPIGSDAVDGWGASGPSRGYITRASGITLGSVTIDNVVVSLSTQDKGVFSGNDYQGNVGGGILKRFVVTFDYNNQVMYLKPLPGPVADIGTYDRAGMWINQSGTGFKIVDITGNSPAEEADLKVGDKITAVDGKPATDIPLYDLRLRLRNDPPGTVVTFTVLHGTKIKTAKVTLRDLI